MKLVLAPESCMSRRHALRDERGPLGELRLRWTSRDAEVLLAGERYIARRRPLACSVTLRRDGRVVLASEKERLLGRTLRIHGPVGAFRLLAEGLFCVTHHLRQGQDLLGTIRREGRLSSGWSGEFDASISLELAAFCLIHLALVTQDGAAAIVTG